MENLTVKPHDIAPMNYAKLNATLQQYLNKFDLDQGRGGGSLCIYHQGKLVTSLGFGAASIDEQKHTTVSFNLQTLALNFSTGKGILVTLIHVLVSQKLLNYDTPISEYWQNFSNNGKQAITLRQILTHEAGLFEIIQITQDATDMLDWQAMLAKVEQMPISEKKRAFDRINTHPEKKFIAYSALVSGWILGGLIEKVTKLPLQMALEHYLLKPLNLVGQAYFGVVQDKISRVAVPLRFSQLATKKSSSKPALAEDSANTLSFYQTLPLYSKWQKAGANLNAPHSALNTQLINRLYFSPNLIDMADYKASLVPAGSRTFSYYDPASLQAKIPAANGVATSFALATIYAMLANRGEWQDKTLITPEVYQQLSCIANQQMDNVMPAVMQWRLGYHRVFSLFSEVGEGFGHMGYNGSMAWCDPSRELAVAFIHNYDITMLNDIRQFIVTETVLDFFTK